MKYFTNFDAFKKRIPEKVDWADEFRIGTKRFKIYEYGDVDSITSYAYFLNSRTTDMIRIDYILPQTHGNRLYRLVEAEYHKKYGKENLWRPQ
jgi:hypothetical protein